VSTTFFALVPSPTPLELGALVIAGLVAGFVNTLAGGGSLLTLPILVLTGLSWEAANATSRISVLMQSISAVSGFMKVDRMDTREALWMALPAGLGAALGALLALWLDPKTFEPVAIVLLVAVGVAMIVSPKITSGTQPRTLRERPIAWPLLVLIGVYGGFIQAGVGYLLIALFGGVLGRDLAAGNALKAALVLLFTLVALPIFGFGQGLDLARGLTLGAGAVVGAQLAVRFAVRATPSTMRLILVSTLLVVIVVAVVR